MEGQTLSNDLVPRGIGNFLHRCRSKGLFVRLKSFPSMTGVFLLVPTGGDAVCWCVMNGPSQEEL